MAGSYGGAAFGGAAYVPVVAQSGFGGTFPYGVITEIAFTSNPLDDPAVWTDVSIYVRSIQTNRGRQHELSRFEAGTATIQLDNKDGRFSPFNTSSPYNPNVLPYKQVRVRAVYNGITYPIFRGHIESWPVKWPQPNDSFVTVRAVDATKLLNTKKAASLSNYKSTLLTGAPTAYYRLNETPQPANQDILPISDSSGNGNNGSVKGFLSSGGSGPPCFFGASSIILADTDTSLDCGPEASSIQSPWGTVLFPSNVTIGTATDWSISVWIYARVLSGRVFFFGGGAPYASLDFTSGRVGTFDAATSDGTNTIQFTTIQKVQVNTPTLITMSWQASGKKLKVAVNGTADLTGTNASISYSNVGAITVGGIHGVLDEPAIWTGKDIIADGSFATYYTAGATPRSGEKTGARIGALLDAVGWPSSLRKVDTGTVTVQGATNDVVTNSVLSNCQVAADTENGDLFVGADGSVTFLDQTKKYVVPRNTSAVTLGDSGTIGPGGESPYLLESVDIKYDDLDIWNEVAVTPAGFGAQIASNTASQTTYGKRTLSRAGIHLNASDATTTAQMVLDKYGTPRQRIQSVTFQPLSDPTVLLPAALGFELLTRVTVKRRPKDGTSSTFTQSSLIEGVELTIAPGYMECAWRLSPTDASPLFFIIGDPVAGQLDGSGVLV